MKGPAMGPVNVGVIAGGNGNGNGNGNGGGIGGIVGVGLGGGGGGGGGEEEESWRHFNNSINAISFGFVATAILISMFLVMAIFERFLRPTIFLSSDDQNRRRRRRPSSTADLEAQQRRNPKMSIYAKGVSVLMPGNDIPTFIAHPAPAPCPPERIPWPSHQHIPIDGSTSISS